MPLLLIPNRRSLLQVCFYMSALLSLQISSPTPPWRIPGVVTFARHCSIPLLFPFSYRAFLGCFRSRFVRHSYDYYEKSRKSNFSGVGWLTRRFRRYIGGVRVNPLHLLVFLAVSVLFALLGDVSVLLSLVITLARAFAGCRPCRRKFSPSYCWYCTLLVFVGWEESSPVSLPASPDERQTANP